MRSELAAECQISERCVTQVHLVVVPHPGRVLVSLCGVMETLVEPHISRGLNFGIIYRRTRKATDRRGDGVSRVIPAEKTV